MECDVFKELDIYRENNQHLSESDLQRYYPKAINEVQRLITEKRRMLTNKPEDCSAEIKEGEADQEGIRSFILSLEERLYDLSSDGELGQKIKSDQKGKGIEIKNYETLLNEIL